ncbi:hypothetical protein [Zymomonas mobilis]|uniref:hypothetical protein n=1 Tax=Zymomonas mobilis TaxID=542 RepID=UPI0021C4C482|nr:hypothetical protein [Zymomonas mobilis]MCP9307789.1 hypothetical protein [Zymomonas mobilis]
MPLNYHMTSIEEINNFADKYQLSPEIAEFIIKEYPYTTPDWFLNSHQAAMLADNKSRNEIINKTWASIKKAHKNIPYLFWKNEKFYPPC